MKMISNTFKEKALSYIRESLGDGKKLAQTLGNEIDFSQGEISIVLTENANKQFLDDFSSGGKTLIEPKDIRYIDTTRTGQNSILSEADIRLTTIANTITATQDRALVRITPLMTSETILVEELTAYFSTNTEKVMFCVFEEPYIEPQDQTLERVSSKFFIYEQGVYLFTLSNDRPEELSKLIKGATQAYPPAIGVVGEIDDKLFENLKHRNSATQDSFREIITRTTKVIIGAYDGEGYLIWTG